MNEPRELADKQLFDNCLAAVKSTFNQRDVTWLSDATRRDKRVLHWTDHEGRTLLHVGILQHVGGDKIRLLLQADAGIAEVPYKGRLPLHLCLDSGGTFIVASGIYELLNAHPKALLVPDYVDGSLPLHTILASSPFPAVYVELGMKVLELCPEAAAVVSNDDQKLPLHICLEQGLQARLTLAVACCYRGAASRRYSRARLPLHAAVEYNADVRVVSEILEAYPSALMQPMVVSGEEMLVLEFAIRNRRPETVITALMTGGSGRDPRCVAIARAIVMGRLTRVQVETRSQFQSGLVARQGAGLPGRQRKKIDIFVGPEAGEPLKLGVLPEEKIEELQSRIHNILRIPESKIKLTYKHPTRGLLELKGEDDLRTYDITQSGAFLHLGYRSVMLHHALRNKSGAGIALLLLNFRPVVAAEMDEYGVLPLQHAIENLADEAVVINLIDKHPPGVRRQLVGGAVGEYPLHSALKNRYSLAVINKLLEQCSERNWYLDPRTKKKTGAYCPEARTLEPQCELPLHLAMNNAKSAESAVAIIDTLLSKKCPVEARDPVTGRSALDVCVTLKHMSFHLFNYIFEALSKLNPVLCHEAGPNGQCPLHVAVAHNANQEIIEMLCKRDTLEEGAKAVLRCDIEGRLPIHLACSSGANFAAIRALISHCPEAVNKTDGHGRTPLQLAVTHNAQPGVVFEITRRDKNTVHALWEGRSLIELACAYDAPSYVVQEILEASPQSADDLNVLDWPNTKATAEALRLVMGVKRQGGSSSSRAANRNASSMNRCDTCGKKYTGEADSCPNCAMSQAESKAESSSIFGGWFNW